MIDDGATGALLYFAHLFLGRDYEALGDCDQARSELERAAALYPNAQTPRLALSNSSGASVTARPRSGSFSCSRNCRTPRDNGRIPWWGYYDIRYGAWRRPAGAAAPCAQTFSSRIEAVRVDVLVTATADPCTGLTPADFEVIDNGVRQSVDLASFEQIPLNVVLALDMSASLQGLRLGHLQTAGSTMLDGLKPGTAPRSSCSATFVGESEPDSRSRSRARLAVSESGRRTDIPHRCGTCRYADRRI